MGDARNMEARTLKDEKASDYYQGVATGKKLEAERGYGAMAVFGKKNPTKTKSKTKKRNPVGGSIGGLIIVAVAAGVVVYLVDKGSKFDPWSYDFDGDGIISVEELQMAVDDQDAGVISFDDLIDVLTLQRETNPEDGV